MPSLSQRTADLVASPIREILAVVSRPGMISFAGGLPAPDTFPAFALPADSTMDWRQYGASEGEPALREAVATLLADRGLRVDPAQVLILSGSQQGIDLVAKLCIDPGTPVAVESPTYLAALQVFRFFGARLQAWHEHAPPVGDGAPRPALVYLNPTFQNPTGRCLADAPRDALAACCEALGTLLFEDDPYHDLALDGPPPAPVCARMTNGSWVYQGSFSKSLAPGLRLGYLACSRDLVPWLVNLKQAADLHSCRLSQQLVLAALRDPAREARLAGLRTSYRARRDAFAEALETHFGALARWDLPPGGLFFWLALHDRACDTAALLAPALAAGVAFMPGAPFFAAADAPRHYLRLNFSHASIPDVPRGLAVLAGLIRRGAAVA